MFLLINYTSRLVNSYLAETYYKKTKLEQKRSIQMSMIRIYLRVPIENKEFYKSLRLANKSKEKIHWI